MPGLQDGKVLGLHPKVGWLLTCMIGPISLVVITSAQRFSAEDKILMDRIQSLQNQIADRFSLSLHLLHVVRGTKDSPNAYLNLARLFAPTKVVVLFPGNLSVLPPVHSHASVLERSSDASDSPVLITSYGSASPPFPPLSALRLNKDHTLWCTERFFSSPSREQNWQECLRQFWLDSIGEMSFIHVANWVLENSEKTGVVQVSWFS
jgi:hypothetical protein